VVISIIALLISILLPSLRDAREQSKQIVCRNNLRSIWTGILTYSMEYNDRIPYLENPNKNDPNADPFDPSYPNSVGQVLSQYVEPGSWVCPSAVAGYPANVPDGEWTMTYAFSTADTVGDPIPYDDDPNAYTGNLNDPAMRNYVNFDGRPIRLLEGRRYVSRGKNYNEKGYWNFRFPIISDMLAGEPLAGMPRYPHRGAVKPRLDLEHRRKDFEKNSIAIGKKPAYLELHADNDRVEIILTRFWVTHRPGY